MYRDLYGKGKVKGNEKLTYGTETSRSKCNKINNENRHLFYLTVCSLEYFLLHLQNTKCI